MNYMWHALLRGTWDGISKNDIHFIPTKVANPYREVFFSDVNKNEITKAEAIEVNALYRYASVFEQLINGALAEHEELRLKLFDILAHYISEMDLHEGLCHAVYYTKFLRGDIEHGLFGMKNAQAFEHFSSAQERIVLSGLLRTYQIGLSLKLFARLLRELYPNSIVYLDARDVREFLVYIGKKQTNELTEQVQLLCDLFIPADYDVHLFWDMHFGLIGVDETMEIGNFMMY